MSKLPRVRFVLPGLALAALTAVLVACGGDDKPPVAPGGGPSPTPGVSADAKCTGGDKITSIKRDGVRSYKEPPPRVIDTEKTYSALLKTSKGDISLSLAAKDAPNTVNNFVFLSCHGFYDGLVFHRVVKDPQPFVIQTGDPRGNGSGGPGYIFNDEISPNLKHEVGTVAMANAGPNTNGSQFYITLSAVPSLDGKYNIFGKVTDGQSVADKIAVGDKIVSIAITEK
jgi:peptidyl-prolyl cis-trans isomerase B (cyclophilin B)